jgi:nucleoside-diphosphate-sugar epimerase
MLLGTARHLRLFESVFMSKPLCLVTGACGFIGAHMVEVLHERGYRIRATDLASAYEVDDRVNGLFPSVVKRLGVEFVPADLTVPRSLAAVVKDVQLCFHVAAEFNYSAPFELLERVNYDGTRELVHRLLAQPSFSKLVHWGAGGVYSMDSPMPLTETSPMGPGNDYLRSKSMGEQLVMDYGADQGLRYSIVRPTSVYGPRGVYGTGQMIRAAAAGPVAMCPSNWDFRIPFVHVRDVCQAALMLSEDAHTDGEAYNLNDSSELTNVEFFRFVGELLGKPFLALPPVGMVPVKAVLEPVARGLQWLSENVTHQPPALEADVVAYMGVDLAYSNKKLLDAGYELTYPDARHGITDTILWYQRNGWL